MALGPAQPAGDGMARPSNGRTERVDVRLTPAEAQALAERAAAFGASVSDFVRLRALGADAAAPVRRRMPEDAAAAVRQLSAIGNNLNQIARFAHSHDLVPPANLERALLELREAILELRK